MLFAASPARAEVSLTVQPDVWNQLVFPGAIGGKSVRELLDDPALEPSAYGDEWAVFVFDTATQAYIDPGIDGSLEEGTGFWMIKKTGGPVTLDSTGVPYAIGRQDPACDQPTGCSVAALGDSSDGTSWALTGNPFEYGISAADARVSNTDAIKGCRTGCSLAAAADNGVIGSVLWTYDAAAEGYDSVFAGELPVWTSFWVATAETTTTASTRLLLPDPFCS